MTNWALAPAAPPPCSLPQIQLPTDAVCQLAACTALRCLDVELHFSVRDAALAGWTALSSLRHLRLCGSFYLSDGTLAAALAAMPCLQVGRGVLYGAHELCCCHWPCRFVVGRLLGGWCGLPRPARRLDQPHGAPGWWLWTVCAAGAKATATITCKIAWAVLWPWPCPLAVARRSRLQRLQQATQPALRGFRPCRSCGWNRRRAAVQCWRRWLPCPACASWSWWGATSVTPRRCAPRCAPPRGWKP